MASHNNEHPERDDLSWQDEYDFSISHLITEARIYAGLTQEKLAELAGTTQSSIARAENGDNLPGHSFLKRIAVALGTKLLPPKFDFMKDDNSVMRPERGFTFVDHSTLSLLLTVERGENNRETLSPLQVAQPRQGFQGYKITSSL